MNLRKFDENGIQKFSEFLVGLGSDPTISVPTALLADQAVSIELHPTVNIEQRNFANRFECAQYMDEILTGVSSQDFRDAGLWAWMSLFYFDQVCPSKNGKRAPGERARHIPQMSNFQRFYRHLLLNPLMIYRAHIDHLDEVMGLLANAVSSPGDISEQLASRQELITNRGVLGLATRLYFDPKNKRLKKGAGGKSAGSPRRLADFLNQIDLTFDLYAMEKSDLASILPREFERFSK
jgi:hypothetical protein